MAKPFDIGRYWRAESPWSDGLMPIGEGDVNKESFAEWWKRVQRELAHLPPDLCEQWIYRHWKGSPFRFLNLASIKWERRVWEGEDFLATVYRALDDPLDPEFDFNQFQGKLPGWKHPTALALDEGTWDYPVVLLRTPDGIVDNGATHNDVRFVLVEGHQRHRYLNALHALGRAPTGPHDTIIISAPLPE